MGNIEVRVKSFTEYNNEFNEFYDGSLSRERPIMFLGFMAEIGRSEYYASSLTIGSNPDLNSVPETVLSQAKQKRQQIQLLIKTVLRAPRGPFAFLRKPQLDTSESYSSPPGVKINKIDRKNLRVAAMTAQTLLQDYQELLRTNNYYPVRPHNIINLADLLVFTGEFVLNIQKSPTKLNIQGELPSLNIEKILINLPKNRRN